MTRSRDLPLELRHLAFDGSLFLLGRRPDDCGRNGKDYVRNPENKSTLTMSGVLAKFERAKIMERAGRSHRLRMGEMSSNGHCIYEYRHVGKAPTSPAALVINEEQAAPQVDLRDVRERQFWRCHHIALP
jgi:hypothetical protein